MRDLTDRIISAIGSQRSAAAMAQATYAVLCQVAMEDDMDPQFEVFLREPGHERNHGEPGCYWLAWEAGPDGWAYEVSTALSIATGKDITSPHSFSLEFDPRAD